MPPPPRRPRTVDTSTPLGPHTAWDYRGWLGLGNRRATARGFEVAPNTGLHWWGAVADQLQTFSRYGLGDVHVRQVPLDEWDAVRRAVKDGARSEDEAIQRLSRSPQGGWVAIDPVTKLRRVLDVGDRPLAMAQRVVHQVGQVLAPACTPLGLTDGLKE